MRRTLITATGSAGAIGLAGCLGDDDDELENNDTSGGDDEDTTSGDGEGGGDGGDEDEVEYPNYVVDADPAFGRMETDWEDGTVDVEVREDELDEEAEEIAVIYDGETIESGPITDPSTLPVAGWYDGQDDYIPLVGEVTVELHDDFGDVIAEMEWDIESDIDVAEIARAANADVGDDIHEDAMYVRLENDGYVGYLSEVGVEAQALGLDDDIEDTQNAGPDNQPIAVAEATTQDTMIGPDTTELIVGFADQPAFNESGYAFVEGPGGSDLEMSCEEESEGEAVFRLEGSDDVGVEFAVTTDGERSDGSCDGIEIDTDG